MQRVTLLILLVVSAAAVGAQQPASSAYAPTSAGSAGATIAGTVVNDVDQSPVRRAIVSALSTTTERSVVTGEDGTFRIDGLPSGAYRIAASKPGYLKGEYGASRPGRLGITIALYEDQRTEGILIRLLQGSAIAGSLTDISGNAAQGVQVTALRLLPGGLVAATSYSTTSDGRGRYRLFGLPPGEYIVCGIPPFSILPGGSPAVAVADFDATVAAIKDPSARIRRAQTSVSLIPVFFPGTFVTARAARIAVGPSQSRDGIDMTILPARAVAVDGMIFTRPGAGTPVVSVVPVGPDLPVAPWPGPQVHVSQVSDGRFDFRLTGLPSGGYVISAQAVGPPGSTEWSTTEVQVGDDDIRGVSLAMRPATQVRGRIALGSGMRLPVDLSALQVSATSPIDALLRRRMVSGMGPVATSLPAPVTGDGRFRLEGLTPGQYQLKVNGLPPGWFVRSAILDGRDVLDSFLQIDLDTPSSPLDVVLSNGPSELSGVLQSPAGQEPFSYYVLVFPSDAALRRAPSRRVKVARPSTSGEFRLHDLPPGEYILGAVVDFEEDDLWDPAFFTLLEGLGIKISLDEGDHKRQDVRIGR